jgi:hypothetical protein
MKDKIRIRKYNLIFERRKGDCEMQVGRQNSQQLLDTGVTCELSTRAVPTTAAM